MTSPANAVTVENLFTYRIHTTLFQKCYQTSFCKIRHQPCLKITGIHFVQSYMPDSLFQEGALKPFIKLMDPPGILRKTLQGPCSSNRLLHSCMICVRYSLCKYVYIFEKIMLIQGWVPELGLFCPTAMESEIFQMLSLDITNRLYPVYLSYFNQKTLRPDLNAGYSLIKVVFPMGKYPLIPWPLYG